ncbi:DUF3987 domain-containing protein [Shewanella sp. NKUCC01_JLK]|uniref:YfjI family protein n=1 Tax=Shewanella sp. NKUCC01_JLK TaxID=2842123 RepID=UPI001C5B0B1F|nr:YfjI family protein [Shewanella sp. NKUCC01_JLK]MBW3513370.1 DUF3987 domain-containing protein [Shewanella sp. NKUCC01_JLK]
MNYFRYPNYFPISDGNFPNLSAAPLMRDALFETFQSVQAPYSMIMLVQLSTISTALQGAFNVSLPINKKCPLSILAITIAESGERKSTVESQYMEGLKAAQKELLIEYRSILNKYIIKKEIHDEETVRLRRRLSKGKDDESYELALNELQAHRDAEPIKPRAPKFLYEDVTKEALLVGLNENLPNAFLASDEGGVLFKSSIMRNSAILNSLWGGGDVDIGRKTLESFVVSDARLTMHIMTQWSALQDFIARSKDDMRGNGFFARAIVANPFSLCGFRQVSGYEHSKKATEKFNDRIKQLLLNVIAMEDYRNRVTVTFSKDAKNVWLDIANDIEIKMGPGGMYECAKDHASKVPENIARVAALIHCFEHPGDFEISVESLWLAIELLSYFSRDFMRVFCPPPKYVLNALALCEWLKPFIASGIRYMRKNYFLQCGPYCIRKKAELQPALDYLKQSNKMEEIMIGKTRVIDLFFDLEPDNAQLAENLARFS